jgi:ATP-binding cassette subfamily B protein
VIRRLFAVLDPPGRARLRRMLIGLVTGAVVQGCAFALLVPVLRALLGPDPTGAWPWLGLMAATWVVYSACYWDSIMAGYTTGTGLSRTLHHALGDHIATLPVGWFTAERSGQLTRLTGKGVQDIMGTPAHLLRPIVTAFVTPLVVIALMAVFDWRLALAAMVTVPLAVAAYRWTGWLVGTADHAHDAAATEAGGRVLEFAQAQPVLRAFRRTVHGHRVLDEALVAQRDAGRRLLLRAVPGFVSFVLVVQLAFTVVLLVGTYLALGGTVDPPVLVALLVLAARFVEPLVMAADLGGAIRMAGNALDRVHAVLAVPPLPESSSPGPEPAGDDVELRDVGFGYVPGEPVLHGVSLRVPARGMTALVGPSGSGKTTVTRLVARFFDVDSGAVLIGGVDVRMLTTEQLMARVSVVFQDVYLFDTTIAENVRVGRPSATDEEVRAAARAALLDEVVERLPDGWDSRVGEGGEALSGGERQRVSIARAILKDAPIVLLDEATAALDPENEAAVQQAMSALTADRTLLVVAHRLQTIAAADRIAVLEAGRIVELGRHAELLDEDGRYARFWSERTRAAGWRLAGSTVEGDA